MNYSSLRQPYLKAGQRLQVGTLLHGIPKYYNFFYKPWDIFDAH